MASAAVRSGLSEHPVRVPPGSETGPNNQPIPLLRQAFGSDVVGSQLSPRAQLGYRVLADHVNRGRDPKRPYDGRVFLTDEKFAAELGAVSKRQVQRIRSELLVSGWICLPQGDAGGRGNATIWYHLHPEGRPCVHAAGTLLKQRNAAGPANARRALTRQTSHCQKDDKNVILSDPSTLKDDRSVILSPTLPPDNGPGLALESAVKDDTGVILSAQRMTESTVKDDRKDVKDDKNGVAYKEELFQELIPEPKSTTTATEHADEFPPEFARLMDSELLLDDGALRRLWQGARAIVTDATAEEIRDFFCRRARAVYRNRKLENPTGLMLSSIRDWFPKRKILEHRKACLDAAEAMVALRLQLAEQMNEIDPATAHGQTGLETI